MKTLSLVMIVKNELKVIERCFDSVKDYIDYWVICDTGSTDGTQEFIQSYFKKHKIPGILYNHTWENFGHNRSLAVQAAKGTSDFLLLMDADFIFVPKDVEFKKTLDTNVEAYHVGYEGPLDFKQLLLVRGNIDWYYKGVTHEYITNELFEKREKLISTKTCTFFTFDHKADGGSRSDKFERDIRLLKEALEKEPDNVRYMFYLAQSYRDTQQFEEAIEWYSKRIEKGGWPEEVYFSMYQRGLCKVFCNREFEEYAKDLWEAYQYRPSRLEALYVLLVECRKKNKFDLGYKYGIGAINTPYPKKDYLFVQSPVYKYHIWNEIAFHCSKMNKPHISIQLYNRIHEQKNVPEIDTQQFANNYTLFVKQYRELQEKEKEKEQKVGIIIVNRNETEQTDTLIQYLQKNIQIACDVILIDNGSTVKSSFTTISLQSSINKRNALLIGIEYLQTLEVLHNRRYTTIGFIEPSCVFQNNTDCIQEIQNTLYKDTTLVGVHPFVLGTTEYPFIHTSYTKHQVSYIPSICCFYKADWLYNNLFSKATIEEGFEIELGYKARDKKIIVDHTYQVECSYALHEPTHYFINTYGKDYTEKLYTNISSNYEQEEKRNVEMVIEKKKQIHEETSKEKKKICILIIYNETEKYKKLLEAQRTYIHSHPNCKAYFVQYREKQKEEVVLDGDMISVKGKEGVLQITNKTIKALEYIWHTRKESYDYLIRSNISTFCNLYNLYKKIETLPETNLYTGGLINNLQWIDKTSGIYDKSLFGTLYYSGTSIIISNDIVKHLIENVEKINYSIIDDITIALYIKENLPEAYKDIKKYTFSFFYDANTTYTSDKITESNVYTYDFIRTKNVKDITQDAFFSNIVKYYNHKIPKIIHQLWIGPKKRPDIFLDTWSKDYISKHPEYTYILWTEKEIEELQMENKKIYDLEETYNGKSDIARYEILYKYGGIWIDADSVWINNKSLDYLFDNARDTKFFAAIENTKEYLASGIIGSSKGHPNLRFLLDEFKKMEPNYIELTKKFMPWQLVGPLFVDKIRQHKMPLTIYPTKYFYPIHWHGIKDPELHKKIDLPKESYMFQYGITTNNLQY